jgi:undecaprenyl phosphate-alpha-L-ara4FN deformylase
MTLCLRLDIDTLADCRALPGVLEALRRHDARATFFVATGPDRAGLNLSTYLLRPWRLVERRVWRRYGTANLLTSIVDPRNVEETVDFQGIREAGHEVSLHGYEHTLWIKGFKEMGRKQLEAWIEKGLRAFEAAAGFRPAGFASPGFTVGEALLLALERFGFRYSSDFRGDRPFYPRVQGRRLSTPQIPVAVDMEAPSERGGVKVEGRLHVEASAGDVVVAYMHPSSCLLDPGVLERALEAADAYTTFGEVARSL